MASQTPPLRILQIGMDAMSEQPGGLARYFGDLSRALQEERCLLFSLVAGTQQQDGVTEEGFNRFTLISAGWLRKLFDGLSATHKALVSFEPDIIVSHFALHCLSIVVKRRRPAIVTHFHGPWALEAANQGAGAVKTAIIKLIEKFVYKRSSAFIVLSDAFKILLCEEYGINPSKVYVIPGGVDLVAFEPDTLSETRQYAVGTHLTLLCVRRLVPRMGLEVLIEAIALLKAEGVDVSLTIVGSGPLNGPLREMISRLSLQKSVHMPGRVSDLSLKRMYQQADCCVMPSQSLEGYGLSIGEGLAAGVPSLVTPVGGMPKLIAPLSPELVLQSTGIKAIADGIRRVVAGDLRLPTRYECRSYAESELSWSPVARRVIQVYDSVRLEHLRKS